MAENASLFDTSNFEPSHPLYSKANHRLLGKLKSETGSVGPRKFVGLRAKMYSLHVPANKEQSKIRAKGIKKSHVKKNVRHEHFLNTIKMQQSVSRFRAFRSHKHVLQTVEINKRCLNAFDDKCYILEDGVATLSYGHKSLRHEWLIRNWSNCIVIWWYWLWSLMIVLYKLVNIILCWCERHVIQLYFWWQTFYYMRFQFIDIEWSDELCILLMVNVTLIITENKCRLWIKLIYHKHLLVERLHRTVGKHIDRIEDISLQQRRRIKHSGEPACF